jgi:hypothetical protein
MRTIVIRTLRVSVVGALAAGGLTIGAGLVLAPTPASALGPACTDSWKAPVSGNWDTAADWSTGAVPGAGDVACITVAGTYTVTFTPSAQTETVDAVEVGSGTVGDAETLAVVGTCSDNVNLVTKNTAFGSDVDTVASTGIIDLSSTGCGNNATLTIGSTLDNAGSVNVLSGVGGARTIAGGLTNDGSVTVSQPLTYEANGSSGAWDNAGGLNISSGETVTLPAPPATPPPTGATFTDDTGGTVAATGTGQLVIDGGNTYNQGAGTTSGSAVLLAGPASGTGVALHYTGTGASTIVAQGGTGTLDGTIATGQTLTVNGTCSNNALETVDASEANSGAVHLASSACGNTSELLVTAGDTFTNQSPGTLTSDLGVGGARTISGTFTNQGTVTVSVPTTYAANGTSGKWDNAGTLDVATGATLTAASSGATFTDDTGGTVAATGTGQLVIDGGNTYNQGAGTTSGSAVLLAGPASGTGVALHYTGTGASTIVAQGGTGTVDGTVAAHQDLTVNGTCSNNADESLDKTVKDAGTIDLTSSGCGNNSELADKSGKGKDKLKVVKGGVLQTDAGVGGARTVHADVMLIKGSFNVNVTTAYMPAKKGFTNKGTVAVASSAVLTDAGKARSAFNNASGKITGAGELIIDTPDTFKQGKATITGVTVLVDGAKLSYTGNGAGTIEAEGTTSLLSGAPVAGQTLDVNGTCSLNAVLSSAGNVMVNGALELTSSGCGNNATVLLPAGDVLTIGSAGSLKWPMGVGGTRTVTGSVVNNGTIGTSAVYGLTVSGNLTEGASGTYAPSTTTGGSSDSVTVGGTATLGGTLAPTGTFTASTLYTILHGTNSGSFTATNGWTVSTTATAVQMSHP